MDDKAKAARRAYKREWARKNPDKCRKYQENYWTKIAEQAEQAEREANGADTPADTSDDLAALDAHN